MPVRIRELGQLVRTRRLWLGMDQSTFSQRTGIPVYWIGRLERGELRSLPEPEQLEALSRVLDVPVTELLEVAGYRVSCQESKERAPESPEDHLFLYLRSVTEQPGLTERDKEVITQLLETVRSISQGRSRS